MSRKIFILVERDAISFYESFTLATSQDSLVSLSNE